VYTSYNQGDAKEVGLAAFPLLLGSGFPRSIILLAQHRQNSSLLQLILDAEGDCFAANSLQKCLKSHEDLQQLKDTGLRGIEEWISRWGGKKG
jgi:putative AlgH/UPF0301 family transcriptional regulator